MNFDLAMTDSLLATTRSVRKRLDLERPVPRDVLLECLELAVQAPTGSNAQTWRWIVVDDAAQRAALAELYRKPGRDYLVQAATAATERGDKAVERVYASAIWLADNLERVPVFVIPCVEGRLEENAPTVMQASLYGSIFPAVWNFQLALRARGLGSTLTTLHLLNEPEAAKLLGLPENILQVALLPVGYTNGTDFKKAQRPPVSAITHWNVW
jgi:nitroreductase